MLWWPLLLIPAGMLLAAAGAKAAMPPPATPANIPQPIAVGSTAQVQGYLDEINAYLAAHGVNTQWFGAAEITRMPETPTQAHAIPPRAYWPGMAYMIREVAQPLRQQLGVPFALRGYRPPDYNAAVGGAPRSRHQFFDALDIRIAGGDAQKTRELALRAAQIWRAKGEKIKMGLGVYGGYPQPSSIHVDAGGRASRWASENAHRYIAEVAGVA